MRIRNIFICMLASMLCLGIFCPKAVEAAQTPQEFVKEFGSSGFSVGNPCQELAG